MADVHDPATRSKNMRAIRPQGTRIEKQLLQVLQSLGVAACQQVKELPGRPDFVIPERKKSFLLMVVSGTGITVVCINRRPPAESSGWIKLAEMWFVISRILPDCRSRAGRC